MTSPGRHIEGYLMHMFNLRFLAGSALVALKEVELFGAYFRFASEVLV